MKEKVFTILKSGIWFSGILTFILVCCVYQIWNIDLNVPSFCGYGDGVSTFNELRNFAEGGWLYYFENMAAPYGCNAIGKSTDGIVNYGILWVLVQITKNTGFSLNLFYLLSYPLTAMCTYFVLRRLEIGRMIAVVGGVLYSFLPYHYLRTMHLNLFVYFMIPLSMYGMIQLLRNRKFTKTDFWITFMGNLLVGIESLYYAAFTMILYGFLFLYNLLKKRWKKAGFSFFFLLLVIIPFLYIMFLPMFKGAVLGGNFASIDRPAVQINIYGLRIWTLLVPVLGHRVSVLGDFTKTLFNDLLGVSYDVYTMPLGFIMSVGLLVSLFSFLIINKMNEEILEICGKLAVIMLLISMVNGIDVIIANFVTTSIRCYNRMSVMIGFTSVVASCIVLSSLLKKKRKIVMVVCCLCILFLGVWDQTPGWISEYIGIDEANQFELWQTYEEYENNYYEQTDYWTEIENLLTVDSVVFCMPFEKGENYPWGYRFTKNLQWNYNFGTLTKTQEYTNWMKFLDTLSLEKQILELRKQGVSGIVILRDEYSEPQYNEIVKKMKLLTGMDPICDKKHAFWIINES